MGQSSGGECSQRQGDEVESPKISDAELDSLSTVILSQTNIMLGTHSAGLIAESLAKGVEGINKTLAWEAVRKDAEVPPERDLQLQYADREEYTPMEVRAGLTLQKKLGWVAHESTGEFLDRRLSQE